MNPEFKNIPNEQIETTDGRTFWISRSCAVIAQVCVFNTADQQWYILLGKRGSGTPDCQGYWNLPCGYLDWNETLGQAMVREVWEECGLHLPSLSKHPQFGYSNNSCILHEGQYVEEPWSISDIPNNPKQNVSMHFAVMLAWHGEPLPALSNANAELNEVDDLAWVKIEEACKLDLAFNHHIRIQKLLDQRRDLFEAIESHY